MIKLGNTEFNVDTFHLTEEEIHKLLYPILERWQWEFSSMGNIKTIEEKMRTVISDYIHKKRNEKLDVLL